LYNEFLRYLSSNKKETPMSNHSLIDIYSNDAFWEFADQNKLIPQAVNFAKYTFSNKLKIKEKYSIKEALVKQKKEETISTLKILYKYISVDDFFYIKGFSLEKYYGEHNRTTNDIDIIANDEKIYSIFYFLKNQHPELKLAISPVLRKYNDLFISHYKFKDFTSNYITVEVCGNGFFISDYSHIPIDILNKFKDYRNIEDVTVKALNSEGNLIILLGELISNEEIIGRDILDFHYILSDINNFTKEFKNTICTLGLQDILFSIIDKYEDKKYLALHTKSNISKLNRLKQEISTNYENKNIFISHIQRYTLNNLNEEVIIDHLTRKQMKQVYSSDYLYKHIESGFPFLIEPIDSFEKSDKVIIKNLFGKLFLINNIGRFIVSPFDSEPDEYFKLGEFYD